MPSSTTIHSQDRTLRMVSLGALRVHVGSIQRHDLPSQRLRCALLLVIAVERETTREALMALLWPERSPSRARHSLSQALYGLRTEFGTTLFGVDGERVWAAPRLEVDAIHFCHAVADGDLEAAASLYAGPFLAGVHLVDGIEFDAWTRRWRTRLAHLHRQVRQELVQVDRAAGRRAEALSNTLEWVENDPLDDEAQHTLIELLAEHGLRTAALRAYQDFEKLLADELGIEPLARTRRLADRLRSDAKSEPGARTRPDHPPHGILGPAFEMVRTLGEGSMATVYLARDRELGRLVAVKVLKPELAADPVSRSRFQREARSQARITHPNVVAIHAIGVLPDGAPFTVMEYVAGRTLRDHMEAQGALSCEEIKDILSQVSAGLEAAHAKNIVHRDVRPSNILVEQRSGRAVVSDFGLAMVGATGDEPAPRLTRTGEVVGNPAYVSPESLAGRPATSAADVYGLGMLAFELLVSAPGRSGPLALAGLVKASTRLSDARPDVPAETASLVHRCLAADPERRPTAGHVARVIATAATESAVPVEPVAQGRLTRTVGSLLRRRIPHAVGATLGASYLVYEAVTQLVQDGLVPSTTAAGVVVLFPFALAATTVVAWFHGERGPQEVPPRELWILAGLGVFWLTATTVVLALT